LTRPDLDRLLIALRDGGTKTAKGRTRRGMQGHLLRWQLHRPGGHHTHKRKCCLRRRTGFAEQTHDAASGPTVDTDGPILLHHRRNAYREHWTETVHVLQPSSSAHDHHSALWRVQPEHVERGPQFVRLGDVHRARRTRGG
jgi:hypothetical protein